MLPGRSRRAVRLRLIGRNRLPVRSRRAVRLRLIGRNRLPGRSCRAVRLRLIGRCRLPGRSCRPVRLRLIGRNRLSGRSRRAVRLRSIGRSRLSGRSRFSVRRGLVRHSLSPVRRGLVRHSLSPVRRGLIKHSLSPVRRGLIRHSLSPVRRRLIRHSLSSVQCGFVSKMGCLSIPLWRHLIVLYRRGRVKRSVDGGIRTVRLIVTVLMILIHGILSSCSVSADDTVCRRVNSFFKNIADFMDNLSTLYILTLLSSRLIRLLHFSPHTETGAKAQGFCIKSTKFINKFRVDYRSFFVL